MMHDEDAESDYHNPEQVVADIRRMVEVALEGDLALGYRSVEELVTLYCDEAEWQDGAVFSPAMREFLIIRYRQRYGEDDVAGDAAGAGGTAEGGASDDDDPVA